MRKIEGQLLAAITAGDNWRLGNTCLNWSDSEHGSVGVVTLFDRVIARIYPHYVTLLDAGWPTLTTKSRLNALIRGLELGRGIWAVRFRWYFAGYYYQLVWGGEVDLLRWNSGLDEGWLASVDFPAGYAQPFVLHNQLWAFPPLAVMPVPFPAGLAVG